MSELADALAASLAELGPSSTATLALHVRRRRATVVDALHREGRFYRVGKRRGARWHLQPAGWTADDLAARTRLSGELTEEFLEGDEGFVQKGLVQRMGPRQYETTELGLAVAAFGEFWDVDLLFGRRRAA